MHDRYIVGREGGGEFDKILVTFTLSSGSQQYFEMSNFDCFTMIQYLKFDQNPLVKSDSRFDELGHHPMDCKIIISSTLTFVPVDGFEHNCIDTLLGWAIVD